MAGAAAGGVDITGCRHAAAELSALAEHRSSLPSDPGVGPCVLWLFVERLMPRRRPSSVREAHLWHGRLGGARFSILPGASTGLAASVVRLERARLEPGAVARSLITWSGETARPGSCSPFEVRRACEVLTTALAALPVKASRELRTRIVGLPVGRQLPVLGIPELERVFSEDQLPAPLPAEDLVLDWQLGQAGWAVCRIADEKSEVRLHLGYCTDALRDLLAETASVIAGRSVTTRFSFDAEPTEYRWLLRAWSDGIEVCIYRFSEFGDPDGSGVLWWRSYQPRLRLASAFADAAERVLDVYGEEGYLRRWMAHQFPVNELRALRRLA